MKIANHSKLEFLTEEMLYWQKKVGADEYDIVLKLYELERHQRHFCHCVIATPAARTVSRAFQYSTNSVRYQPTTSYDTNEGLWYRVIDSWHD